ncbi:MAG: hypothetical protein V9E94_03565 [Microthrixaceae bacterium]
MPGRRTGRTQRIPIGLADVHGRWYAVSMLGECNWVRNLRANANGAVLRHGAAKTCVLVEAPGANRPAILRRYLEVAPGGRPHIPATAASSTTDLVAIADAFPVFAIQRADGRPYCPNPIVVPRGCHSQRRVRVRRLRVESTMKVDLKREIPSYSARRGRFDIITVPPMRYLMIDGHGDPNTSSAYAEALATIYPVAYKLKFRSKRQLDRDYIVAPLEALWWSGDMAAFTSARDKDQWDWTVMLLVPDWLDVSDVDAARAEVDRSGSAPALDLLRVAHARRGPRRPDAPYRLLRRRSDGARRAPRRVHTF